MVTKNLHTISTTTNAALQTNIEQMTDPNLYPEVSALYNTLLQDNYAFSTGVPSYRESWIFETFSSYNFIQNFDYSLDLAPTLFFVTYTQQYITILNDKKNNPDVQANITYAQHQAALKQFINL